MILLLAPDTPDRKELAAFLTDRNELFTAMDPYTVDPAKVAKSGVAAIVLDLGSNDAIKFLKKYAAYENRVPVVCIADRRRAAASAEALRLGAIDIVARPFRSDEVIAAIANAREFGAVAEWPDEPFDPPMDVPVDGVFGASPVMRDVLGIVRRVAPSRCAVLILGERGTGREMVARSIHAHGPRQHHPFIRIACDDGTSEAELGPLLNGSPSPGATVYLDNIGDLPMDLQIRLEDHLFAQVGSSGEGMRFLASAQPRIFERIDRGLVRRNLADALSVVRIDLPPLRQRPQDVPLLAMHFLKEACRRNNAPLKTFSRSAQMLLSALPWAGNAAELRSLCERIAVLVPRGVVLLEDVLAHVRFDGVEALGGPTETLREARDRFERDYVSAVLQQHRGRMGAAARQLGIERTNLYRKIRQLNIRWIGGD
jgi:two-component system, NtrC family, nitrogen regulation response regulator NtrX